MIVFLKSRLFFLVVTVVTASISCVFRDNPYPLTTFLKISMSFMSDSIPLRYLFMELFCGVICLLYFYDFLSLEVTYFLYFSLCLSIFDLKHKSYPLLIWIVGTVPLLFMGNYYLSFALGIILAILSYMKHLNIGEGDFLYLASASLIFPFSKYYLLSKLPAY